MVSNKGFFKYFKVELQECSDEFDRNFPKKGESWKNEEPRYFMRAVEVGWDDLQRKFYTLSNLPAAEDQAVDLINYLLMFIQQSRSVRKKQKQAEVEKIEEELASRGS